MKLKDLASKPQLVKLMLDDEAVVTKYGEALEFYIQDKMPIEQYSKLAMVNTNDAGEVYMLVKDLILDEDGLPVISGDNTLPLDLMNAAVMKVTENLGK